MAKHYSELLVWQKAIALAKRIYQVTATLPDSERFGLVSQMRRAAVSVPSNVAEGQGRLTYGEFKQFLGHARGSLFEVKTQVILAHQLDMIEQDVCAELKVQTNEVARMLNGLIRSLDKWSPALSC